MKNLDRIQKSQKAQQEQMKKIELFRDKLMEEGYKDSEIIEMIAEKFFRQQGGEGASGFELEKVVSIEE
jgi:ribosomal 50S subunit-associated protein YjgA (DUF615 family)